MSPLMVSCRGMARHGYNELGVAVDLAVDVHLSIVLFDHNVMADRQAETSALAGRLGGEERFENLRAHRLRNADAIVAHTRLHLLTQIARCQAEHPLDAVGGFLLGTLGGYIEAVANDVDQRARELLWVKLCDAGGRVEILL